MSKEKALFEQKYGRAYSRLKQRETELVEMLKLDFQELEEDDDDTYQEKDLIFIAGNIDELEDVRKVLSYLYILNDWGRV
jgi:hypothetical protein